MIEKIVVKTEKTEKTKKTIREKMEAAIKNTNDPKKKRI